jgi:hypothetical protein
MKLLRTLSLAIAAAALLLPATVHAQVVVNYDPNALESNFGSPSDASDNVAYTIALSSNATDVNLQVVADPAAGGALNGLNFVNLYFSTGVATGAGGSNLGFEIGNSDAFVPGENGSYSTAGDNFSVSQTPGNWNISIPWTYFETDPDSIGFTPISASNDILRLNLSQSFGYSVAGGSTDYGDARLGEVTLEAAPEPSSYALAFLALFAFAGIARLRARHA